MMGFRTAPRGAWLGEDCAVTRPERETSILKLDIDDTRLTATVNGTETLALSQTKAAPVAGAVGLFVDIGSDSFSPTSRSRAERQCRSVGRRWVGEAGLVATITVVPRVMKCLRFGHSRVNRCDDAAARRKS